MTPTHPFRLCGCIAATLLVLVNGCARELSGPKPEVASLDPSLVCTQQLVTEITMAGDRFSPVVIEGLTDAPMLALPQITLRRTLDVNGAAIEDGPEVTIPDDPADPASSRSRWVDQHTMRFDVFPELELAPGLYDVTVTNRNGETVTLAGALTAVDPPILTSVVPDLICLDQSARTVTLSGENFLQVGTELPVVSFGGVDFPVTTMDDCIVLPGPTDAQLCQTAHVTIPQAALAPGAPALVMFNPEPAACHSENVPDLTLAVVPRPTVTSVVPDLICLEQGDRSLTVTGTGFVDVAGTLPTLSIGMTDVVASSAAGCTNINGTLLAAQSCTTLTVVVPQDAVMPGSHDVTVTNPDPAGCVSEEAITMAVVPAPSLVSVVPDIVCNAEGDRTITLNGTGFVTVAGVLPEVAVGAETYSASAAGGCTSIAGTLLAAETCSTLTVVVPQNALSPGAHAVSVTNPAPAGCTSTETVTLTITPPPVLTAVQPELACNTGANTLLTLSGSGFLDIDGALPMVAIGTQSFGADAVMGCTQIPEPTESVQTCTTLTVTVPAGSLAAANLPITVTNPAPAGCTSTGAVSVAIVPAPSVATTSPAAVCTAGGVTLTLDGSDFLWIDEGLGSEALPTVTLVESGPGGATLGPYTATLSQCEMAPFFTGSAAMAIPQTAKRCARLDVTVGDMVALGAVNLFVANPAPAPCASPAFPMQSVPAPTLTMVTPVGSLCSGSGTLSLVGTDFAAGMTVSVGGVAADVVTPDMMNPTTISEATWSLLPAGTSDVTVNSGGCESTLMGAVTVTTGPVVLFTDPAVVYSGIDTPVTVFAANATAPVTDVSIALSGTGNTPTMLSFTTPMARPSRPDAVVPAMTPAGSYDVWFEDNQMCPAMLPSGLIVTDTTDLTLTRITPDFGRTTSATPITLEASDTMGSPGFDALPLVYLLAPMSTSPIPMTSISGLSTTVLSAEVPAGLSADTYDVVVVNQGGSVGLLPGAFTVSAAPPPSIFSLTPALVANQTMQNVTINGSDFRGMPDPSVTLRCINQLGVPYTDLTLTTGVVMGQGIVSSNATSIDIVFDGQAYTDANCVVEVTNDDATRTQFSSLVIVTTSTNLTGFTDGSDLTTPRRRLGAVSGNASSSARFVYAIAGDDGVNALSTVEVLPVDIYGRPGTSGFFEQQNQLTTTRSQLGAVRIGRFVYAVGGASTMDDSTTTLASVERAAILDPNERPSDLNVDVELSQIDGLGGGIHRYRISAVMPATDPFNPGGETLPSATFGMRLPTVSGWGIRVILSWTAVPTAVGYRLYRRDDNGSEGLIADTTGPLPMTVTCAGATSCTDLGAVVDAAEIPLRQGATGTWTLVSDTMAMPVNMSAPRQGAGVTWALDPADASTPDDCWQGVAPCTAYLYAIGGLNDVGILNSYEYLTVSIATDGTQTTTTGFSSGTATLPAARWRAGAFALSPIDTPWVGGDTFIWVAGGATNAASSALTDDVDGAQVLSGGQLGAPGPTFAFTPTVAQQPSTAGYGAFAAGDVLYVLGGAYTSGPTADTGVGEPAGSPPALNQFQNFNPGLLWRRADPGAAIQSGYFYILGGNTTGRAMDPVGSAVVTISTEYVLY